MITDCVGARLWDLPDTETIFVQGVFVLVKILIPIAIGVYTWKVCRTERPHHRSSLLGLGETTSQQEQVDMDKKQSADVARHNLLSDLQSPDELVRTRALGSLCPCRNDWELFEQHVKSISRLTKNRCRSIRAGALHMLADAARLQSIEDAEYRFQSVEDVLHKKRRSQKTQVRRSGEFKRRKGSFVLR